MEKLSKGIFFVTVDFILKDLTAVVVEDDYFLAYAFISSNVELLIVVFVLVMHEVWLG